MVLSFFFCFWAQILSFVLRLHRYYAKRATKQNSLFSNGRVLFLFCLQKLYLCACACVQVALTNAVHPPCCIGRVDTKLRITNITCLFKTTSKSKMRRVYTESSVITKNADDHHSVFPRGIMSPIKGKGQVTVNCRARPKFRTSFA